MPRKIRTNRALIFRLDARYRFYIALAFSIVGYFIFKNLASWPAQALSIWIVFALTVIITEWLAILWAHPLETQKTAHEQDSNRSVIFLFVTTASLMSLGAIIFLLKSTKEHGSGGDGLSGDILLAMGAVTVSWWLVHTIFAMRYAHLYYDTTIDEGEKKEPGGLEFPGEPEPDYLDFVYFSFVIGMTFQVSDTGVRSRKIRRLVWIHGLISFVFNTAIVALSINVISGLVSK